MNAVHTYTYTYDGNGNVVDVMDDEGTSVAHYEYDPFGRTISSSGTFAEENRWRFSTKSLDESGLYYYGYRYYSPELGRWPSRDPIGEDGGLNLYGFVGNMVICRIDAYGLQIQINYVPGGPVAEDWLDYILYIPEQGGLSEAQVWTIYNQVKSRYAFKVSYTGGCECPDGSLEDIVFVQYLKSDGGGCGQKWEVDKGGENWLDENGFNRVPAYTDDKDDTGSALTGLSAVSGGGAYYDSPTDSQRIRIEAYCRCCCADDFLIDTREFDYKNDWQPGDPLP